MRKLMLILFVSAFFSVNCSAQLLKIGIKAGVNYSNFESSQIQTDALTSYHLGVITEIKLLKSLSLQPEILYSTQGAFYKTVIEDVKQELGYVSVPILAKVTIAKTFSVEAGPQFSYLLSKKITSDTDLNEFDFGVAGGIGVKITKSIFIQGRYVLGLTEIDKNADFKNAVAQLSVGFLL